MFREGKIHEPPTLPTGTFKPEKNRAGGKIHLRWAWRKGLWSFRKYLQCLTKEYIEMTNPISPDNVLHCKEYLCNLVSQRHRLSLPKMSQVILGIIAWVFKIWWSFSYLAVSLQNHSPCPILNSREWNPDKKQPSPWDTVCLLTMGNISFFA